MSKFELGVIPGSDNKKARGQFESALKIIAGASDARETQEYDLESDADFLNREMNFMIGLWEKWNVVNSGSVIADDDELGLAFLELKDDGQSFNDFEVDAPRLMKIILGLMLEGKLTDLYYTIS